MTKSRAIQVHHPWTKVQLETFRALWPDMTASEVAPMVGHSKASCYSKAHVLGLKKSPEFWANESAKKRARRLGLATRFGAVDPWNKGKKGLVTGGQATQFKPGNLSGRAKELRQPVGSERISEDGYRYRKVTEWKMGKNAWMLVHILMCEEANGPVNRKTHAVVFKNGDKTDIGLEYLELISRADNMRRNSVHNYGREVAELTRLQALITRAINKKEKQNE